MVPDKVAALQNAPCPQLKRNVQRFLGLVSYYRCLISHFVTLATTLSNLTQGRGKVCEPVQWTSEAKKALQALKNALCLYLVLQTSPPTLAQPPFMVYTDASGLGLGTVLDQAGSAICSISSVNTSRAELIWP